VNEAAGHVEYKKSTRPKNEQEQSNYQERSESHFCLLSVSIQQFILHTQLLYDGGVGMRIGKTL
jgi:hypothetical protein